MWLPFSTKHSSARITSSKLTTEPQRNTLPLCQINRMKEMKRGIFRERRPAVEISGALLLPFFRKKLYCVFIPLIFSVRMMKTSPARGLLKTVVGLLAV